MQPFPAYTFPFGLPVCERAPHITEPRQAFLLGAYPSALHVFWRPSEPYRPIQAIAVDNEPDFFWNGENEAALVAQWQERVKFAPEWGQVSCAGRFNGSSGLWVDQNILRPFGLERGKNVWISDCLTTYRLSPDLSRRLKDTYQPFAQELHRPLPLLRSHPGEDQIVAEALREHKERLIREMTSAGSEIIITLGNAALRVVSTLVESNPNLTPCLVADTARYGQPIDITLLSGHRAVLYPLAHPAARPPYPAAHADWIKRCLAKNGRSR